MMEDANKDNQVPTFELVLRGQLGEGIQVVSLVADPAVELPFFAFSNEDKQEMLAFSSDEQRIVTGILMVPNKLIARRHANGDMYNIFFSEQTLREAGKQFAKSGFFNNVNLEHEGNNVEGVYLNEIWYTGKEDKIYELFAKELVPVGSIAYSLWVENEVIWKDIKKGKYKGFSLEGMFNLVPTELSKEEPKDLMKEFEDIILNECLTDAQKEAALTKFLIQNTPSGVAS